jgi:phosphonate transport system ATP-binding protein
MLPLSHPDALVRYTGVTKRFDDGTVAVDHIGLAVPAGQFCVLLGPSGAGKSTLLRMLNGMIAPTSGQVVFDGMEVRRANLHRIQPRIAMIHQQFNLVPRATVLDNVLAGALPHLSTAQALLHLFPRDYQRKACHLLQQVGLKEMHLYRRATYLSGGQQQRVAIARAFLLDPALVLADEPVASLDPTTSHTILGLLHDASRETGATVICSLHQVELALKYADRVIGMRAGRIVFDGAPDAFDAYWHDALYQNAAQPRPDDVENEAEQDAVYSVGARRGTRTAQVA